jgi:hypothetical protein
MKTILLAVAILIAVPANYAQTKPIKVSVLSGTDDPADKEVADKIAAKIGSTSRYALVSNGAPMTALLIEVSCLTNTSQKMGSTCDTEILYWPMADVALSVDCPGSMVTGLSESDIAQALFESFVRATTDEKLEVKAAAFKLSLNYAIRNHPKGVE